MQDPLAGPSHQSGGGIREVASSGNGVCPSGQPQPSATTRIRSAAVAPESRLPFERPAYVPLNEQASPQEPVPPVAPTMAQLQEFIENATAKAVAAAWAKAPPTAPLSLKLKSRSASRSRSSPVSESMRRSYSERPPDRI